MCRSRPSLFALLLSLAASACAEAPEPPGDLVIVTIDTLRADRLGCYGYFRDTTPELDRFAAEEAVLFGQIFASMATTLPSHTSLFTGLEPLEHGVLANSNHGGVPFAPRPGARTLAQMARRAGYRTAAFVSSTPLKAHCGLASGFEVYDAPEGHLRRGTDTLDLALEWLARTEGEPRLLWVHLFDPHHPLAAPPEHQLFRADDELGAWLAEREFDAEVFLRGGRGGPRDADMLADAYDAEVHYTDAQVGRLLDALRASPRWARTTVVVTADHGEGLGQHGRGAHGRVHAEQLHVPFLARLGGPAGPSRAGSRVDALGSMIDLLPTVLPSWDSALAAEFGEQSCGRDLLAPSTGAQAVTALLGQRTGRVLPKDNPGPLWSLTTADWRYHHRPELGDLLYARGNDPHELADVAQQEPRVARALLAELLDLKAAQIARGIELGSGADSPGSGASGVAGVPLDAALLREFEALGYAGAED